MSDKLQRDLLNEYNRLVWEFNGGIDVEHCNGCYSIFQETSNNVCLKCNQVYCSKCCHECSACSDKYCKSCFTTVTIHYKLCQDCGEEEASEVLPRLKFR